MKNTIALLLAITCSLAVFGQTEKVKGNLATTDTADLTILNIYPDSFPNVSVIFRAETRKGEPVWNLTKEKMKVRENAQNCDVISLEQISKNRPINLGIVIDHSGSMQDDPFQLLDKNGNALFSFDANSQPIMSENYISPIDNAKLAVKDFVSTFNTDKDFISIIGFSNVVDIILPLTQDTSQINSLVDSMRADFATALYDALITGIDEIKNAEGVKVVVALTDGQDNLSKSKCKDVIDYAKKENVPIYIIGLGRANVDTLSLIAESTKGQFYYTKSSNSLDTVYAAISKQVQAFYELIYNSPNFSSADTTRQIELSFDIDTIYLISHASTANFPAEVIEFIANKEREIEREKEIEFPLYYGVGIVVFIGTGVLLYYFLRRKRKKNQPIIKKLFPNPSDGNINLDYVSNSGYLQIIALNGQVAKTIELNGTETQFDLTDLQNGNYIAVIQADGQQSNAIKFILQR